MKNKINILCFALAVISSQAVAGTATATFQATATLSSSCVVSATNVNFGTITPEATGTTTATGTITATCSNNVPYNLAISAGSGTTASRTMLGAGSDNTDKLAYNLYTSSSLTTVWGETVGTDTVGLTGNGQAQSSTVYGSLSNNQYLKPDTYTDNLTVTLSY
ncbi:Csu type fimbrial protein [Burkholderia cenocepacia]|uniref:Csu type fimbrial protein n=1 Tax=Burkholderia cenocepacia TaxID=95486 RepID=UPI001588DE57|nr:spore coat U domain-containing protein [Burkholderia cenocepacia]